MESEALASEFFANEKWPDTQWPTTRWYHRWLCKLKGGHDWRMFLWAWVEKPFDLDVCWNCYKCKGPLPDDRERPEWPSYLNPY
jgi:hypothetical protein